MAMMRSRSERLCIRVRELIAYLRSFEGEDRERGLQAAQNIEHTLSLYLAAKEPVAGCFDYDVGGKGMLDWIWTDVHRARLERFSAEIFRLSHPGWWEFWRWFP